MKKILVTGATGFLGNHIIKQLTDAHYPVIATDMDLNKAKFFKWYPKIKFIEYDINKATQDDLYCFFDKPDILIHLAWQGLPNYNELFHIEQNLYSNYLFLKNIIINGLPRLTTAGTCFEYGKQEGCLAENTVTMPNTPYSLAKDTLRRLIECLLQKYPNCILSWVRLFYVYGPGQSKSSILSLLQEALDKNESHFNMSGGEQLRDYLHIKNMAEYIVKISIQNKVSGIINCCSGKPISIKSLVRDYLKEKGREVKLNFGFYPYPEHEPMAFWGDNTKLRSIIDDHNLSNLE